MTPGRRGRGFRWWCPVCDARGREATADEACAEGVAHYLDTHDRARDEAT